MTRQSPAESIQMVVLDSVLFGTANALEFLDLEGQVIMDKIGAGILEYCFKAGYVEKLADPLQLAHRVSQFFIDNGYVGEVDVRPDGELVAITMRDWQYLGLMKKLRKQENYLLACPVCIANAAAFRSNGLYPQVVHEELGPNGFLRKYKVIPATTVSSPEALTPSKRTSLESVTYDASVGIGLPAFEAVGYGLARGLEYLGAQAGVLLDNVGRGVIEFLKAESGLNIRRNVTEDLNSLASILKSRGLADSIQVSFTPSVVTVTFKNYRYQPVLRLLLDEDIRLVSCPFTLAAKALMRDAGWATGEMNWMLQGNKDATLTMRPLKLSDQKFDEEEIGAIMDQV